jgi:hypothetical protein
LVPEPELRDEDDERQSFPELELIDDEHQLFPTVDSQDDILSAPSTNSGRRSFPELESYGGDIRDEHRSFPTADLQQTDILSLASTGRRSFPELEFLEPELLDRDSGRRSFPTVEVQSTSAGDLAGRCSFPSLEPPDIEVQDRRCSFPAPELHDTNTSVAIEAQSCTVDGGIMN